MLYLPCLSTSSAYTLSCDTFASQYLQLHQRLSPSPSLFLILQNSLLRSKYSAIIGLMISLLSGAIYAGIHYFIIVWECDGEGHCQMRNWTHFFIGVSIAFIGILKYSKYKFTTSKCQILTFYISWTMNKPILKMLSVDYSLPIGISSVGIAMVFHLEHSFQSNQIHLTFAASVCIASFLKKKKKKKKALFIYLRFLQMVLTGVMVGVASQWERWTLLSATCFIWSAALLCSSSDEIVQATEKDFGAGNLAMLCLFIALAHTIFFGLYATLISNPRLLKLQETAERLHENEEKELAKLY